MVRSIDQSRLGGLIERAGLQPNDWYGDWDTSPFTADSREIIVVTSLGSGSINTNEL